MFFIHHEPDNEYEGSRNEMIACYAQANQTEIAETAMDRFFWNNEKAGIVQRIFLIAIEKTWFSDPRIDFLLWLNNPLNNR